MAREPLRRRRRHAAAAGSSAPARTRRGGGRRARILVGIGTTVALVAVATTVSTAMRAGSAEPGAPGVFPVTDDAYVSAARPDFNSGADAKLVASEKPDDRKITFLRFSVPEGTQVGSAKLTLTRTNHRLPPVVEVYRADAAGWSEKTVTMRNAPKVGALVAAVPAPARGFALVVDVSSAVQGPGDYAFAVTSPATDHVANFMAKEAGSGAPVLGTAPGGQVDPGKPAPPIPTIPPIKPTPGPTGSPTSTSTPPAPPAPPGQPGCTVDKLLVPSCGAWLGVAPGAHDFSRTRSQQLATFEADAGRKMDVMHVYHTDNQLFPTAEEIKMAREPGRNRLLFINWKPSTTKSWKAVAAGDPAVNAQIDKLSTYIKKTFPERFFLALYHEPENDVNPTPGSGWTAADYRAMYRYVALRLRANGVDNAVLAMVYMGFAKWGAQSWFDDLYPGDDVVDWVGYDPYATVDTPGSDFATMVNKKLGAYAGWPGFYSWAEKRVPGKPMVLAEWGVAESAGNPAGKADFFRGVVADARQFPRLKALLYFDSAKANKGDTRIASSTASKAGFRDLAADPYFRQTVPTR